MFAVNVFEFLLCSSFFHWQHVSVVALVFDCVFELTSFVNLQRVCPDVNAEGGCIGLPLSDTVKPTPFSSVHLL